MENTAGTGKDLYHLLLAKKRSVIVSPLRFWGHSDIKQRVRKLKMHSFIWNN